jgi:hypothetical protein
MGQVGTLAVQTLLLGSDSLLSGFFIGPLLDWRRRAWLALLYGICDGMTTWVGASIPHDLPDPPLAVLYLICVILVTLAARHSVKWLLLVPFILSLDNLACGAPANMVPELALLSGLMALVGMAASAFARNAFRRGLSVIHV